MLLKVSRFVPDCFSIYRKLMNFSNFEGNVLSWGILLKKKSHVEQGFESGSSGFMCLSKKC